jgi:hypothetical protein
LIDTAASVPSPESGTLCEPDPTLSVTTRLPVASPPETGLKEMVTEQVAPGAIGLAQLSLARPYSFDPVRLKPLMKRLADPVLVTTVVA